MIDVSNSPQQITGQHPGVSSILHRYGISPTMEAPIIDVGSNAGFIVDLMKGAEGLLELKPEEYNQWDVSVLLEYLERSHEFYLSKLIPEVEQGIEALIRTLPANKGYLLSEAFKQYVQDLRHHFKYEEQTLFPYARLLDGAKQFPEKTPCIRTYLSFYSVAEFTHQHGEDEYRLEDFMYLVSLMSESADQPFFYRVAMQQLNRLSKDLNLHAFIEDEVLVGKLRILESDI